MSKLYETTIRDCIGYLIGHTVVDITSHDKEDYERDGRCSVTLQFDDGSYITFPVSDEGFEHANANEPEDLSADPS